MPNSTITGNLSFAGAKVGVVRCYNMHLGGDLAWRGVRKGLATRLDLSGSQVRHLRDEMESWPDQPNGQLNLDGLVYQELTLHAQPTQQQRNDGHPGTELVLNLEQRIAWLMLQPVADSTKPQPWLQLASYLQSKNRKADAKHVLYKFHRLEAKDSWLFWRWVRIAFALLEESPWRIIFPIAIALIMGTLIFTEASPDRTGAMIPTVRGKDDLPISGAALAHYPEFQPFIYTLENALPLVKLGMDDKWTPDPKHQGVPVFSQCCCLAWLSWFNSYWFLAVSRWFLILSGWFQATVLAGALANRFKA